MNNRSKILKLAHAIKKETGCTFGEAQRKAWQVARLEYRLNIGIASFQFIKADGTVRAANGTRNADLFEYQHKGSEAKQSPLNVRYFDMDANAWRSFNANRLIF